jgi:4'-phosphopantetheinyl transferase
MSARHARLPELQTITLDATMPPDLECLLLTLDAPRTQLRIHARAILRELLSNRLQIPASQLEIVPAPGGKPYCPQAVAAGLNFSLSYAPPYACLVLGQRRHIGIDIERVVTSEPTWNLLEHVFTELELQQWLRLPSGEQRRCAFTAAWSIKEAALKARGTGLAEPPQSVGVTFSECGQVMPAAAPSGTWQALKSVPGHVGAIALFG